MGRHAVDELKLPKWIKRDQKLAYMNTIVAFTAPQVQQKDGCEYDFEPELTSKPLIDLKKAKKHQKASQLLKQDPMIVVP